MSDDYFASVEHDDSEYTVTLTEDNKYYEPPPGIHFEKRVKINISDDGGLHAIFQIVVNVDEMQEAFDLTHYMRNCIFYNAGEDIVRYNDDGVDREPAEEITGKHMTKREAVAQFIDDCADDLWYDEYPTERVRELLEFEA